jgi:hypothetical protein
MITGVYASFRLAHRKKLANLIASRKKGSHRKTRLQALNMYSLFWVMRSIALM